MVIGFIGLGKMGGNMVLRLVQGSPDGSIKGGHPSSATPRTPTRTSTACGRHARRHRRRRWSAGSPPPRVVWVMVPAGNATEGVISELAERLPPAA